MVYCMQCGKELNDEAEFCTECGKSLAQQIKQTPAQTDAPELIADSGPPDETTQDETAMNGEIQPMLSTLAAPPVDTYFDAVQSAPVDSMPYQGVFPEAEPAAPPSYKTYAANRRAMSSMYSSAPRANTFVNTWIGLIFIFVLLSVTGMLGVVTPMFFDYANLTNVINQCSIFALIAMAVVLTMRSRGIDLSIGPCIGMSAVIIAQTMLMGSYLINGVLLAGAAALVLGLVNGFASVFLKVPGIIVTLVSGIAAGGVCMALSQGQMLAVTFSERVNAYGSESPMGLLILLGAVFVLVFLYNLISSTGRPLFGREKDRVVISHVFSYVVSAQIAAAAGFVLLVRLQTAMPTLGSGYETYIVFVFAILMMSKGLDNRFVPVLIALVPAMIWGVLTNIFALWGVIAYYQPIIYGGLALISLVFAFICRYEKQTSPKTK